jgi:hypothetical protein
MNRYIIDNNTIEYCNRIINIKLGTIITKSLLKAVLNISSAVDGLESQGLFPSRYNLKLGDSSGNSLDRD